LSAAVDEDEGAFLDEALCCGEADARSAAADHGGLSIQSVHVMHPSLVFRVVGQHLCSHWYKGAVSFGPPIQILINYIRISDPNIWSTDPFVKEIYASRRQKKLQPST